jgi:two-component system CheB/CheR fusion protein
LTIAQVGDGTSPQYPEMPQSAIGSGNVDLAVPVIEMGAHVADFARSPGSETDCETSDHEADNANIDEARTEICAILRNQVGHDFLGYKERTFFRRVQRRMQVNQIKTIDGYIERLRQEPKEVGALFRDLLINVTNFFRDADAFEALKTVAIPKLFAGRGADDTVRAWVPGCATGEEVYSIAILMREHMETLRAVPRVQIFATDIDEPSLVVARAARYPEALLDGVSDERRKKYFTHDDGNYMLTKDVRDICVFSPHNVIRDPPFSRLDLVSCRNLLIYFGPDMQDEVIPTFHYALRPGGYLFLGTSENVSQFSELFTPLDKKNRLFRSREDVSSSARVPLVVSGLRPAPFPMTYGSPRTLAGISLRHAVEGQVLDRYSPAHVAVNRDGDIVYYSGHTGKYLEPMAGTPSRQLLTLAKKGLRLDLRTILREAIETGQRATREGVSVEAEDDRIQFVDLWAEPLNESNGDDKLFLVVFRDVGPAVSREDAVQRETTPDETGVQLERELRETRERLQSLIEEYETALEELKSSNEELVSVNEELQSTNEELEASKEELQSVNEELHTVNAELSGKVDALDRSNADLANLFESTKVATVFLDRELIIRSFTPAVSQIFNMLPGDRGRPLTDLVSRISLPTLAQDVQAVMKSGQVMERAISQQGGAAYYLARLVPYRNGGQQIEGVVLSFVDVTSLTKAEEHQKLLIAELNHRVKNMLAVVISVADQTYRSAPNPAAFKDRFIERVRAMALSYELLSRENWTAAGIGELVGLQLQPFGLDRVSMPSHDIRLSPRQALSLGLVLHELATNAAKYGALGFGGRLIIDWRRDGDDLVVSWSESGGPVVNKPSQQGFGMKLVAKEVSYSLQGKADIRFEQGGLEVTLRFPQQDQHGA